MSPDQASQLQPGDVKPLDTDGVAAAVIGTVLFAVAFLVMLPLRGQLSDSDKSWWLLVAGCGTVIGILLTGYSVRRRAAYRAAARKSDVG